MLPKYQDLSIFEVPKEFRGRSKVQIQLWWFVQATFFRISPQFMYEWRNFLLRLFGARIGMGVKIRPTSKITYPWNLEIGNHSWIGDECTIYNLGKIIIGNNVALAHKVYLCTGMHDYTDILFRIYAKEITIHDEVWLPNDVFVGPGVTIGRGTVVGARSTVLSDLPEAMICYGNPAKPMKPRVMRS
ncbi:MAG: WcaF family extracellular polysaccharide biosynthesis acetyltransferase [Anaerolineaceae bacterium]